MTTRTTVVADGSTRDFAVPFPYISTSHVVVELDGAEQAATAYTWTTPGNIQFPSNLPAGTVVFIRRETPEDPLVEFTTGSVLPVQDLDVDSRQALYRVEELSDAIARSVRLADDFPGPTYPSLYLPVPAAGAMLGWNYAGDALINYGPDDFTNPADLTLRTNLADPTGGAALVSWMQTGTGAVAQTLRDEVRRVVRPEHFGAVGDGVTDDCAAFDRALLELKARGGGVLQLSRGKTYMLSSVRYGTATALTIPSNVTIIAYGATIKRGSAAVALMLRNDSDGSVGGYNANSDIAIFGGTWDPNYPGIAGASMPMGFTHTNRIRIRDAHIFSGFGAHHIEINACSNVVIEGCTFEGGAEQTDLTMEAVQIDGAIDSGTWGTGPYDQTFCTNVKVIGNTFVNCGSGVGTHSSVTGKRHSLITIANNTFSSCYFCGVRALNWENSAIVGNHFFGGAEGVRVYAGDATISKGIAVNNNTFWQIGLSGASGAGNGHAINFYGNSGGTEQITYYSICNNVIRDCAFANSGCGIKVLYCPFGTINGNTIDNVLSTGISIFGNGGMSISGNYVQDCGSSSISAGSAGSVNITDNIVNTIAYTSITRSLVTGNIVANASGITASGTNTNTTAIHNLVSTTFA